MHASNARATLLRQRSRLHLELARIDEELADIEQSAETTAPVYTTAPGGPLPPRRSRRWLREHAAEMGGTRSGGRRGRDVVWTVTHEQYTAWLASRSTRTAEPAARVPAPVVAIDSWLSSAGYRATRVAR